MREPSKRELLLQNRLALASTLLFSCAKVLSGRSNENRAVLLIECESFFSETKSLLTAAIAQETERAESPTSAPAAGKSGGAWNWEAWTGYVPPGPAPTPAPEDVEGPQSAPAPSSESSLGGINSTEPPSGISLITRIRNSYGMKHSNTRNGG